MTVNADNTVTFGTSTTCGVGVDIVPLFLSTAATQVSTAGNTTGATDLKAFLQPVDANAADCVGGVASGCGVNISNPFTVSGTTIGTFVVNFDNQVDEQMKNGVQQCSVEAPIFDFR
jgi:hypothetical protein